MVSRRALIGLGILAGALGAGGLATATAFGSAMEKARAATSPDLSATTQTRFGTLEYAQQGEGAPFLMVHGTGGGFDQGLLFAIRHPDRCAALVPVVPATHAPGADAVTAENPPPGVEAAMVMLRSDFLFWSALVATPDTLIGTLLATDPALLQTVSPQEAARARTILWSLLPVSARAEGLANDARLAGRPAPAALEAIGAPVLAISVEDDRFGTAKAARHIAANVPGAQLVIYPTGGHIWLGHDSELFAAIDAFLKGTGYP